MTCPANHNSFLQKDTSVCSEGQMLHLVLVPTVYASDCVEIEIFGDIFTSDFMLFPLLKRCHHNTIDRPGQRLGTLGMERGSKC